MALLREKTSNRMSYIELAVILAFSAYFIMPAINTTVSFLMALMLGFVYLGFVFIVDPPMRGLMLKVLIAVLVLALLYTLLTDSKTIAETASNRKLKQFLSTLHQYFTMYFPVLLLTRVNQLANKKQRWILLMAGIVMIVYVVITTMQILLEDENATRAWANFEDYEGQNLGNYYFVYAVPIIIALLAALFAKSPIGTKPLYIVAILFFFVFLFNAQYTLAILISIIGIAYQLIKSIKYPIGKVLMVLAVVLFCLFIPNILEFAMARVQSTQIAIRLGEIHTFLTGGGAGGYNLNGRLTLYGRSIQKFLESPIWGNRVLDFSGHATFLTVLCDTGILGSIPFYWLFFSSRKHLLTLAGDGCELLKPVFLMFALMGLTNPVQASQPLAFATFFIAPLLIITIFKKENLQDEKAVEN